MPMKNDELQTETAGFASDLAGLPSFFIDPESAAKRVHSKWFWVAALLVSSVIAIAVGIYLAPIIIHVTEVAPIPDGVTQEQHDKGVAFVRMATKFGVYLSPIFSVVIWAAIAGILLAISVVSGVTARFGSLFNLVAGCWLIQTLGSVATTVILHFKGEISTAAELKPPMGFDIFLPEGSNKYLMAAGGSFSIFQIWWVVMMALIFSAAFRVSKGKSFAIVLPLWFIGLALSLVGAIFQK
jgi:hypothetical protein